MVAYRISMMPSDFVATYVLMDTGELFDVWREYTVTQESAFPVPQARKRVVRYETALGDELEPTSESLNEFKNHAGQLLVKIR